MDLNPIRTERLLLRPVVAADEACIAALRSSEEVTRYLSHGPLDHDSVRERLARVIESARASTVTVFQHSWVIERRDGGEMIGEGNVWTSRNPPEPGRLEPGQAMLGYVLSPAHHRKGYGREAARALVSWLFTERDIQTVFAAVFAPNLASQALLAGLGFAPDLHFTAEQDQSGKGLASIRFRLDRANADWWPSTI
ncbi:GNAT family N-acetyltransferase [Arthrobacter sp. NPDC090010]|uniref:GNAT family N-acetyltransferase n=1 Tax=Arthrobacter sp. NPDC090010 TaxID=3363942 RepID=UPI00381AE3FC